MTNTSATRKHTPKAKKPKKKMKMATERNKALAAFQKARKLQETNNLGFGTCWTCGKIIHISEADGGHGIPRNHKATELEPSNCHLQCRTCNRFEYGEQHKYMERISEVYGPEEVDRLYDMDDAYKGGEDALLRLSQEDIIKVKALRNAEYYHNQYLHWSRICKDEEARKNG